MSFVKWTSIGGFHNVRKSFLKNAERVSGFIPPTVTYKSKVKLHGTNAGVLIKPTGQVIAQSRKRFITPGDDNMGFAQWVESKKEWFSSFKDPMFSVIIYGEWCGNGIARGTAISQLDKKVFALFAMQVGPGPALLTDPVSISTYLKGVGDDVFTIGWHTHQVTIDWNNPEQTQAAAEEINQEVVQVELCDPWVKAVFGKEGIGEGLVYYPMLESTRRADIVPFIFKAKGLKHQVCLSDKPARMTAASAENVAGFVDMVVTEARLEQGLTEACKGQAEKRMLGPFLKWIGQDIKKECQDELEASGLTFKEVSPEISKRAKNWLLKKEE